MHNNTGKPVLLCVIASPIISYQNLKENYNLKESNVQVGSIISYQNLKENYNIILTTVSTPSIISYQNLKESYNYNNYT